MSWPEYPPILFFALYSTQAFVPLGQNAIAPNFAESGSTSLTLITLFISAISLLPHAESNIPAHAAINIFAFILHLLLGLSFVTECVIKN